MENTMKKLLFAIALLGSGMLGAISGPMHPAPKHLIGPGGVQQHPAHLPMIPIPVQNHLGEPVGPDPVLDGALAGLVNAAYEYARDNGSQSATEMLHHAAMNYVHHYHHVVGKSPVPSGK